MNPLTSDGSQVASVSTESVESATKLRYSVKTSVCLSVSLSLSV